MGFFAFETVWASLVAQRLSVCLECRRPGFNPWVRKIPWRRKWQPTPVFLPGESQDRGAWWAAVFGVAQSWTRLKRLSSSKQMKIIAILKADEDTVILA